MVAVAAIRNLSKLQRAALAIGVAIVAAVAFSSCSSQHAPTKPEIHRAAVSSSAMRSVGYDPGRQILEIEFTGGQVYQYHGVPEVVYEGLMTADSHGRYFHRHIKNAGYRYERKRQ